MFLQCSLLGCMQFLCMQAELQAAEEELRKAKEQLKLLHTSFAAASLELEAKERLEYDLKAMTLSLENKQEELDASKVGIYLVSFWQ